jgi:cytochrome P450
VVTSAAGCREGLLNQDLFAKDGDQSAGALITQVMGKTALLNMDGEAHNALRRRLQGLLAPKVVARVTSQALAHIGDEVRGKLACGEAIDVAVLARRVTGTMMCHLVGLRLSGDDLEARALEMYELGQQLVRMVPTSLKALPEDEVRVAKAIFEQLVEGIDDVYETGSTETIPGHLRELGLTREEARGVVGMLLIAGTETTSSAVARMVCLLHDTHQWELLARDRSLMGSAIDEALRICTPVPVCTRTTRTDGIFRGRRIKPGRLILFALTRATRDPRVISDGDHFDIRRKQPRELRLLWFGAGPHFCIGYHLAIAELQAILDALLDGAPSIDVVRAVPARGVLLPTWDSLVIRRAGDAA